MKKKLLSTLMATAGALTCAIGLAACGDDNGGGGEQQPLVEQKMTEQEWQTCMATFAAGKNFSLTLTMGETVVGAVKMNGDTYYDNGGAERILTKEGAVYTKYSKNSANDDWSKSSSNETEYNYIVNTGTYTFVVGGTQAFAANYASFSFADGKYTADTITAGTNLTLKDITVTVANGNVSKIECTQAGATAADDRKVAIDSIGSTSIPVPQIPTVYTVDQDTWTHYISFIRNRNFTVMQTGDNGKTYTYRVSGTAVSTETEGKVISIYAKEGNEYFKYTPSENGWVRTNSTSTIYENKIAYAADQLNLFRNAYSSFTFADNKYTCQSYEVVKGAFYTDAEAEFNDGRLISFSFKGGANYEGYSFLYKDFDTTIVEIPDAIIENA